MSHLLPRRISELASIDSDQETPEKPTQTETNRKLGSLELILDLILNCVFSSCRLPRRVADLDLQESDSEDDKNDRLVPILVRID